MRKNKGVILPETMDETTLVNQMTNFIMNGIHKINDALEYYDKF